MFLNEEQVTKLTQVAEELKIMEAAALQDDSLNLYIGDIAGMLSDTILSILEEADSMQSENLS